MNTNIKGDFQIYINVPVIYEKTLEKGEAQAEKVEQGHNMSQEEVTYN